MKYFPLAGFRFTSSLSDDELVERLSKQLEPRVHSHRYKHWIMTKPQHRTFEGTIYNYHLKMNRVEYNSGFFNPLITGRIRQNAFNTTITIDMKIRPMNGAVLGVFMTLFTLVAVVFFLLFFTDPQPGYLVPMALWLTFYAYTLWQFKRRVRWIIADLSAIFQCEPEIIR